MHVECDEVSLGPAFVSKSWRKRGGVGREKPIWEPAHYLLKMESHGLCVREVSLKQLNPPLNNLGVNLGVLVSTMLCADSKVEIWWR